MNCAKGTTRQLLRFSDSKVDDPNIPMRPVKVFDLYIYKCENLTLKPFFFYHDFLSWDKLVSLL